MRYLCILATILISSACTARQNGLSWNPAMYRLKHGAFVAVHFGPQNVYFTEADGTQWHVPFPTTVETAKMRSDVYQNARWARARGSEITITSGKALAAPSTDTTANNES